MVLFLWAASGRTEPEPQDMPFSDVPASAPYYKAVMWALQQQIVAGTSASTFSPDALCSRAEAMTILWRAVGSPAEESDGNHFYNVPCGKYYYRSVTWAATHHQRNVCNDIFSPSHDHPRRGVDVPLHHQGAASIAHGPYDAHAPVLALEAGKEIIRGVYRKSLSIRSRFFR